MYMSSSNRKNNLNQLNQSKIISKEIFFKLTYLNFRMNKGEICQKGDHYRFLCPVVWDPDAGHKHTYVVSSSSPEYAVKNILKKTLAWHVSRDLVGSNTETKKKKIGIDSGQVT